MQKLLELPKALLVALLLGGGIIFIVLLNPPVTVCDSQIEIFKQNQTGFLYLKPKEKLAKTSQYESLTERCKDTNSPGGCYELFLKMRQLLTDIDQVHLECAITVASLPEVKKALWAHIRLMVELAWGAKPPTTFYDKLSWFDPADLALYCRLKKALASYYGEDAVTEFREKMFKELPGAQGMSRNQIWDMMLLSLNCDNY